jgi:hypothetical protein
VKENYEGGFYGIKMVGVTENGEHVTEALEIKTE